MEGQSTRKFLCLKAAENHKSIPNREPGSSKGYGLWEKKDLKYSDERGTYVRFELLGKGGTYEGVTGLGGEYLSRT